MPIIRVTFTGISWGAINSQNVCAFSYSSATFPTQALVAAELRDNWCTILAAGQTNQFGWRNISIYEVGSGTAPFNLPIVVNGIDATDPTTGTQVLCQKFRIQTATGGRKGRGRIYLPGYRANLWSQGQLNATGITNMSIRLNAIKNRYVGIALGPSNILLGVLPRGDDPTKFLFATDLSLSLVPGVQRRRSLGIGI